MKFKVILKLLNLRYFVIKLCKMSIVNNTEYG